MLGDDGAFTTEELGHLLLIQPNGIAIQANVNGACGALVNGNGVHGCSLTGICADRCIINLGAELQNACMPLHIQTPLIPSLALSARTGLDVWLKMESAQPPGSFKLRGVGLACQTHAQRGARRFMSSSGGNAGMAVAYAGRMLGLPVEVVVPQTTSVRARELIALLGARLTVRGAFWQEANELAQSMMGPQDAFIHPFDDPLLWEGHATLVDEVAQVQPGTGFAPDAVVLAVGGGAVATAADVLAATGG